MVKVLVSYSMPLELRERLQAVIKGDVDLVFSENEENT